MDNDLPQGFEGLVKQSEEIFGKSGRLGQLAELDIDQVKPGPWQPRQNFDEEALQELADSIKSKGQLEAGLVVFDAEQSVYLLIAGERRWRASQLAGLATYKAEVLPGEAKDYETKDLRERALISNVQREDLDPFEEASSLQDLMNEYNYTLESLGEVISKKKSTVEDLLRLNDLSEELRDDFRTSGKRVSKSMLIEVAREKDATARASLWQSVRDGRVRTIKQARAKKREAKGVHKRSIKEKLLHEGRSLLKRIQTVEEEDVTFDDEEYQELLYLYSDIGKLLEKIAGK